MEEDDIVPLHSFDGQTVWTDRNTSVYEVGNFLGGGAAGTVYECEHVKSREHFALKILNPIGYKMTAPALLKRCIVACKGKVVSDAMEHCKGAITLENVWWLINGSTKQYLCAYFSEKSNSLKEFSLPQCIQLWGVDPIGVGEDESGDCDSTMEVTQSTHGPKVIVPSMPPKYSDFVRKRRRIFREIRNMRKISRHINVIRLENVLELTQESKSTIFLVMELANGGELFDRIKLDCGTREDTAKLYFQQLLAGVRHCHEQGVCHRDLKPENLLLQDLGEQHATVLKIADFGFSARIVMGTSMHADRGSHNVDDTSYIDRNAVFPAASSGESPLRVLKSVVGSPFYVAPEVLQARGYDGPKADIWSLGVILYAMLAGNLPFEQELTSCKRFRSFCKWVREQVSNKTEKFWEDEYLDYPQWLFPSKFSIHAKSLIVAMLHPDPEKRILINEAMEHALLRSKVDELPTILASVVSMDERVNEMGGNLLQYSQSGRELDSNCVERQQQLCFDRLGVNDTASCEDDTVMEEDENCDDDDERDQFVMEEDQLAIPQRMSSELSLDAEKRGSASDSPFSRIPSTPKRSVSQPNDPPPAPPIAHGTPSMDDLLIDDLMVSESDQSRCRRSALGEDHGEASGAMDSAGQHQPPSFHDFVKRSTRFITAVSALEVLEKVDGLLDEYRNNQTMTPIGIIGKVSMHWESYRLEVWGSETSGPSLCALQLYQIPASSTVSVSPVRTMDVAYQHHTGRTSESMMPRIPNQFPFLEGTNVDERVGFPPSNISAAPRIAVEERHQDLFLVEFIRGQLDIFAFKRFYQWVRLRVSELVKRDYSFKLFDQAASPMVDSAFLQRHPNERF